MKQFFESFASVSYSPKIVSFASFRLTVWAHKTYETVFDILYDNYPRFHFGPAEFYFFFVKL